MRKRLRVRAYNVRFGDAILVSVPDKDPKAKKTTMRHILIDVGNAFRSKKGSVGHDDGVFKPIVDDILKEVGEHGVDLYVMTHEHLDHVQGLPYAAKHHFPGGELKRRLKVKHAWLTASADPGYYDDPAHEGAAREKLRLAEAWKQVQSYLQAAPAGKNGRFQVLLANNDPNRTADCIDYLRGLGDKTHYVHVDTDLRGKHPFKEAKLKVWAPEENTADYFRGLLPMAKGPKGRNGVPMSLAPPPGVDAGAFQDLVAARSRSFADNLLAIDKAANNTSVVFSLEWRGHRLLFTGDAELRSWSKMAQKPGFKDYHFLKVSHHGSHNGTPSDEILDQVMPAGGGKRRHAVISTWKDTYNGIPHDDTDGRLKRRAELRTTLQDEGAPYVDTFFG